MLNLHRNPFSITGTLAEMLRDPAAARYAEIFRDDQSEASEDLPLTTSDCAMTYSSITSSDLLTSSGSGLPAEQILLRVGRSKANFFGGSDLSFGHHRCP